MIDIDDLAIWRERTSRTCRVCGVKTVVDGRCTICGAAKVVVGEPWKVSTGTRVVDASGVPVAAPAPIVVAPPMSPAEPVAVAPPARPSVAKAPARPPVPSPAQGSLF